MGRLLFARWFWHRRECLWITEMTMEKTKEVSSITVS